MEHHTQVPTFGQVISCDICETGFQNPRKCRTEDPGPWCKVDSHKVQTQQGKARTYLGMFCTQRRATSKCQSFY